MAGKTAATPHIPEMGPSHPAVRIGSLPSGSQFADTLRGEIGQRVQPSGLFGQKPLDLGTPDVSRVLQEASEAGSRAGRDQARTRLMSTVDKQISTAGKAQKFKKGAGMGVGLLAMLPFLFGNKKDQTVDPAIQMQLAQQLAGGGGGSGGGGVNTGRTLTDVSKLLSIIKALQGMASMQGPVKTQLI